MIVIALGIGCAPPASVVAPPASVVARPAPFVAAAEDAGPLWSAASDADRHDVVVGSARASLRSGAVTVAAQRFARPPVWAQPAADGWLFVGDDGTVERASSFLGSLAPLGRVAPPLQPPRPSRGRLALVDGEGSLWTTNGRSPPARAALPAPCLVAAFADERRGAAVLDGGALAATADGGASWRAVDLGGEAAWDVAANGALRVETTAGARLLAADGALGEAPPSPPPPPPLDAAEIAAIRRATGVLRDGKLPPSTRAAPLHWRERWRAGTWACAASRPAGAPLVPPTEKTPATVREVVLIGPATAARITIRRDGERWRARAAWQGSDGAGAFAARTPDAPIALRSPGDDQLYPDSTPWSLIGAWREGLLARRCADEQACDLVWAAPGRPLLALDERGFATTQRTSLELETAHEAAGGVVLLYRGTAPLIARAPDGSALPSAAIDGLYLGIDRVVVLGPDGAARMRRTFVRFDADAPAGLARTAATAGYAALTIDGALHFRPFAGAPPPALPDPSLRPLPLCRPSHAPLTLEAVPVADLLATAAPDRPPPNPVRATVELGESGACLRAIAATNGYGLFATATSDALVGTLLTTESTSPLRCLRR